MKQIGDKNSDTRFSNPKLTSLPALLLERGMECYAVSKTKKKKEKDKHRRLYRTTSYRILCCSACELGLSLRSSPPCRHFEVAGSEVHQMERFLFISYPAGLGLVLRW